MTLKALLVEFRVHVKKIERAYELFQRVASNRRTVSLKKKNIAEATAYWNELSKNCLEIEKELPASSDDCYENEKTNITALYKLYMEELMNITDVQPQPQPRDKNVVQTDEEKFVQQQQARFGILNRALEDVESKITRGEGFTVAYCKMKIKSISEIWQRIQMAAEECVYDITKLDAEYLANVETYEINVEDVLVLLQSTAESPVRSEESNDVKLPRVEIPKFNGDYFKWMSFRDMFKSMVVDKKSLSDVQSMHMLKTNVTGEAETLLADLTITDANFTCAWERLKERFDNNRVVVYKYLNRLTTQQVGRYDSKAVKKLLDTTDQALLALQNLGRPVESWDDWIILTIVQKLSEESRKDWERKIGHSKELPTWGELKEFLQDEFRMLEGVEDSQKKPKTQDVKTHEKQKNGNGIIKSYQTSVDNTKCVACDQDHGLFTCSSFRKMDIKQRWEMAKKHRLCYLCLKRHKDVLKCDKKKPCKKCDQPHSTWLHESKKDGLTSAVGVITNTFGAAMENKKQVLLATTLITTEDLYGRKMTFRALIDSGSQGSMITDRAADILQILPVNTSTNISGLGRKNTGKVKLMTLTIQPRFQSDFSLTVDCYVLKMLTKMLPDSNLNIDKWHHLKDLQLADPTFNKTGQIDMLLGTDVASEILKAGFIKGAKGTPIAQETALGWIISGNVDPKYPRKSIKCLVSTMNEDMLDISKFWELEELNPGRKLTKDEERCEELYVQSVKKDEQGRFIVKIPFKDGKLGPERLGTSKNQSMARFLQLERKLSKDEKLRKDYSKVINEYIELGHMVPVNHLPETEKLYYIPHHAVIKPDSLTTKVRVVFDASAKTTTGVSLNECMFTGAKQQNDLIDILIKWRQHYIVFKADVEKMYRMVKLDQKDQRYHNILWRNGPSEPIQEFQLTTATFGTASAPFMATRTLIQIGLENENEYPHTSEIIKKDFYVDDLISGCADLGTALQCKNELMSILDKAGFKLRKWTSNSKELLESLPREMTEKSLQVFEEEEETTKALGLQWNPKNDTFSFKINWLISPESITKRKLFSEAAKLFDPLGWLAPVIINAKMMMQEIWKTKIDWDDEVPEILKSKWQLYRDEFPLLEKLAIKRWIELEPGSEVTLHGFCDASEKGYGAVVYTRIKNGKNVSIKLIGSKTRVSPVASKISLPCLELCGAVLVSHLLKKVEKSLNLGHLDKFAWSDSMITLGWIMGEPSKWKTFVANRVAEIQACQLNHWRHVKSEDNPADCSSRGLMPNELLNHTLWWNGPEWLKDEPECWPVVKIAEVTEESRTISVNLATIPAQDIFPDVSSWFKRVRLMAYCLRMKKKQPRGSQIGVDEINAVKTMLYKRCQQEAFPEELTDLLNNKPITSRSRLLQLNPFLDEKGVMRVGGRLQNAVMSYENKHPIILPNGHATTKMIIHQMHKDTLHGGPQLMTSLLRKKYWILQGKRMANDEFKTCVNCRRFNSRNTTQLMGNLPKDRVTLERAFLTVGIDYAGPIEVRSSRLRSAKIQKGYIAVFVCFGTKAIHLELVSDITTAAFMAALNRFIARRGLCSRIYSDNGSNFLGAANTLVAQEKQWLHEKNQELANLIVNRGIEWKFIPPGSPHFGGLWERGVRSVKEHLKRTLKTSRLTFEEYATILCQVEACLNSRPLCALTNDAENLNALTPGHFLIGDALMAPPQPNLLDINANRLNRWRHLQLLQQHFWQRWNNEYLSQLQQRKKWQETKENVQRGDLVLLKDEQLPPRNWLMARIMDVHPGTDGRIRVVTLRTKKGEIKRPITKVCPLLRPNEMENELGIDDEGEIDQDQENVKEMEYHDLGPDVRDRTVESDIKKVKMIEKQKQPSQQEQIGDQEVASTSHSRYGLRPRTSRTFLTLAVIFGILVVAGGSQALEKVKINSFSNNAGMYFEDMGRANIIRTEWHIYLKFSLRQFRSEFQKLQKISQQGSEMCIGLESTSSRGHCEDMTELLTHRIKAMQELNALMNSNGDESQFGQKIEIVRSKRAAPLNVVGWIQHEVFGVMASDQAEHIETQFDLVKEDSNHVLNLLKNQTSIVESTLNLMTMTEKQINENYEKIEFAFNQLANETSYVKRKFKMMALEINTVAMGDRLEKIQNNVLDMLTELHQGHVSSRVFTPMQFKRQLQLIMQNLPVGSTPPQIAQEDIKSLYKIIKGSARITDDNVVIDIIFPLVSSSEFQVIRIVPIPTEHEGQQITMVPDAEYLLITLQKDQFYQMNGRELQTCMKPKARKFICHVKSPLYTAQSNRSRCEREIFMHSTGISPGCKFSVTTGGDFWINLSTENKWIFGTKDKITLNVVCGHQAQPVTIEGSGILELTAGCEIIQAEMRINSESIKQTVGDFGYYPAINLSKAVIHSGRKNGITMANLTLNHREQMNTINHQINELKLHSHLVNKQQFYHTSGTIATLLLIGSIGFMGWYKRKNIWKLFTRKQYTDQTKMSNGVDDEEGGDVDMAKEIHQTISSDDITPNAPSGTISRHRAGECPFRT